MFFTNPKVIYQNTIVSILTYHPYWIVYRAVKNEKFDSISANILKFKRKDLAMINELHKNLSPQLTKSTQIVISMVPAHTANHTNQHTPLSILVKKLVKSNNFVDGSDCLIRHTPIEKLANGGNRSIQTHKTSIKVEHTEIIKNQNILLIDDITTTGNSLKACKELLLYAGAKEVCMLAIAETANDKELYQQEQLTKILAMHETLIRNPNPQH